MNTPKVFRQPVRSLSMRLKINKEESWRNLDSCERKQVSVNDLRAHQKSGFGELSQPIAFLIDKNQKDKTSKAAQTLMACWALQQIHNMSFNSNQRLSFLLLLLALTAPALSAAIPKVWQGWQGAGNISQANMTEIQFAIENNPIISGTTNDQIDGNAQSISMYFNTIWDPAWNVAIVKSPVGHNSVLYGYAFKEHWIWINGVTIPGDTTMSLTYIIWKDYNCQTWSTVGNLVSQGSTFASDQNTALTGFSFASVASDVWDHAYRFVNYVQANPVMSSGAYSIIMSTHANASIRGRFCVVNRNYKLRTYIYAPNGPSGLFTAGSYFLFQTR